MTEATTVHPASGPLLGTLQVPGDKSVSHRAVMLGSLCDGDVEVVNFAPGADNRSTVGVFRALGVAVEVDEPGRRATVHGRGLGGLSASASALDCGNSGTTMRLVTGLLVGQRLDATLIGDASLSRRPMGRITEPLTSLGGAVAAVGDGGRPPVVVDGAKCAYVGGAYVLPIASAQVKSALLLAALSAGCAIELTEPSASRDHTEVMLRAMGVPVESSPHYHDAALEGPATVVLPAFTGSLKLARIVVPGDISSAAFLMVAAAIVPGSRVTLTACGHAPTRTGVLDVLAGVGLAFEVIDPREAEGGEPIADLQVQHGALDAFVMAPEHVPRAIDEIPVLAVLAARAQGTSRLRGVGELRVKESDRLERTLALLTACGVKAWAEGDDLCITGAPDRPFTAFTYDAHDDHRMAAAAAVAALVADGPCQVVGMESLAVSYPGLLDDLSRLQKTGSRGPCPLAAGGTPPAAGGEPPPDPHSWNLTPGAQR